MSGYTTKPDMVTTVAVVGAGMAGLVAARELHRRGVDVLVLEAADRPGGRVLSETSALGSRLDLGGQWIGHGHHRLTALAAELGATKFDMHTPTLPTVIDGPRRVSPLGPAMLASGLVLAAVEVLSRIGTPERWNTATVAAGLRKMPGRTTRRLLEVLASVSTTADLERFSIQALAAIVRYQGGLQPMLSTRGGAQESLLVEGVGTLVDALAAELGARVRTGHRVTAITAVEGGLVLRSPAGEIRAAKAIVTVPPPIAARIAYDPPLPPSRVALQQKTYMGSVYKAIAVYERAFWRDRCGGEFIVLGKPGGAVFDTTPPGGPGHLCVLVAGPEARELGGLDTASRRAVVLGPLVPHVGSEVLAPASWHEKAWHVDEHVGGGYTALPNPGTTEGFFPISSDPTGDLHWAGSETAREHAGYIEGAIESAERAAHEVIACVSPSRAGK